jgi:predicted membrane protein
MEHFEKHKKGCAGIKTVVFGLLVVAAGAVLLLNNLGLIDPFYSRVLISWPMLIIAFGFLNLFGREFPFGVILIIVGGLFMGSKFFDLPLDIHQILWPSIIILVGLAILVGSRFVFKARLKRSVINDDSFIEEVNVFSGGEHIITTPVFKGGKFVNVFGGSKINLLQTSLPAEGASIEAVNVFGGIQMIIPSDWSVKTEVVSIMGGFADKRIISASSPDKKLYIRGVCIFGGGEVKSVPD